MEGYIIQEIKDINEEIMLPTNDYVFHRLFGHVGNEDLTSGLISSILNQEIETIKIDETQITEQNIKDDKVGVLDIKARLNNNILCDVEMQVAKKEDIETATGNNKDLF